ncbi:MAG: hypothetical protein M0Z41_00850 [Peptococcaceae bacterium]|jgi:phosphate uptake regulator|nr:hypothetical protein [Peptococcaceae bacterium]
MAAGSYDGTMAEVRMDILRTGAHVEHSVRRSVQALAGRDPVPAARVIINDERQDGFRRSSGDRCAGLVAMRQSPRCVPRGAYLVHAADGLERKGET